MIWGETSLKRAEGVNPYLWQCATIALAHCKIDQSVQWMGGVRTAEQQKEIFDRGASTKDGTIKKSYHQTGNALDVAPVGISMADLDKMVKGQMAPHPGFNNFAANMFRAWQDLIRSGEVPDNLVLEWGGHWMKLIDLPHWQIVIVK